MLTCLHEMSNSNVPGNAWESIASSFFIFARHFR